MGRLTLLAVFALLAACGMPGRMTPEEMQAAIEECKKFGMTVVWARSLYIDGLIVDYQCQPASTEEGRK